MSTHVTGRERAALAKRVKKAYKGGLTIREIAAAEGRSYGFTHALLLESETPLRNRGGQYGRKKATA